MNGLPKKGFILLACFFLTSCQLAQKRKVQAENHHQLAVSVLSQCNNRLALSHLLKAIKIHPSDFKIRHTLASVYFSLGKYQKAAYEFQKIIKSSPHVTEARLSLALSYIKLKKYKQALREIKKAEKDTSYSNPLKIIEMKAIIDFETGQFLEAKKKFNEIHSIANSQNCFRLGYLGQIEMKLNNFKKAEKILKRSIGLCFRENKNQKCQKQKDYSAHYFLAKIYMKNNKPKAKYHLKIFLRNADSSQDHIKKAKKMLTSI